MSNQPPQCVMKCIASQCFYYTYVVNTTYVKFILFGTHKDVITTQVHTNVPNVRKTFLLRLLEDNLDNCACLI